MKTDRLRFQIVETARGPAALVGGRAGIRAVVLPGLGAAALRKEIARRHPEAVEDGTGLRNAAAAVRRFFETGRAGGRASRLDLQGPHLTRGRARRARGEPRTHEEALLSRREHGLDSLEVAAKDAVFGVDRLHLIE